MIEEMGEWCNRPLEWAYPRGRVLSVQNACSQVAGTAAIGLAAVVAELSSPLAACITVFAVWLVIAALLIAFRALGDLDPVRPIGSG